MSSSNSNGDRSKRNWCGAMKVSLGRRALGWFPLALPAETLVACHLKPLLSVSTWPLSWTNEEIWYHTLGVAFQKRANRQCLQRAALGKPCLMHLPTRRLFSFSFCAECGEKAIFFCICSLFKSWKSRESSWVFCSHVISKCKQLFVHPLLIQETLYWLFSLSWRTAPISFGYWKRTQKRRRSRALSYASGFNIEEIVNINFFSPNAKKKGAIGFLGKKYNTRLLCSLQERNWQLEKAEQESFTYS